MRSGVNSPFSEPPFACRSARSERPLRTLCSPRDFFGLGMLNVAFRRPRLHGHFPQERSPFISGVNRDSCTKTARAGRARAGVVTSKAFPGARESRCSLFCSLTSVASPHVASHFYSLSRYGPFLITPLVS